MRKFLNIAKPVAICLSASGCGLFIANPCIDVPNATGEFGMKAWAFFGCAWVGLVIVDVVYTICKRGK